MRDDEVTLQQGRLVGSNPLRRQFSKAGIDTVDRIVSARGRGNDGRGRLDTRPERRVEHHGRAGKYAREIVEADPARHDHNRCIRAAHCPLHTRP